MKLVLAVLCLAVGASAWPQWLSDSPPDLAHRQQTVNRLLYRSTEPLRFDELEAAAANFHPDADTSLYKDDGVAVKRLLKELEDHRLLEKHHWFSLFNTRQREEALMLFDVLMNSKTWETAVNNAAYFRERVNEGEFVYALYAAVIHSDLGTGIVLPPLYEVTPHMFTNSEVIQKAYTAKMTQTPGKFSMEFTGSKKNSEQRVAYFGEDIGMNVHHVTWHLDFPFWWNDAYGYHLDRKGELFFWAHHQLTVRFDAERLSNNLDVVDELYWDRPIKEGFAPHTTYRYGGEFPTRPDNARFEDVDGIVRVRDMIIHESRIRDAIAQGYITAADGTKIDIRNSEGIDHLGDIIESSLYSPNAQYYGALHNSAHVILGRQADPHGKFNLPPSVMEHFETATRDPAFFRLHKYMDNIFKEHKDSLPPYTAEEIGFPGVHLTSIGVEGKLETFFEDFEFDLRMAVDSSESVKEVAVSATVSRLNHNDFTYEFDIKSDVAKHAVVRVFLCPRRDSNGIIYTFEEGRWNCIEMDKFWTKLSAGDNVIKRKSSDSSVTVPDVPSFQTLITEADKAVAGSSDFDFAHYARSCGIPNRMLLPKGTENGMEFALVVSVTDGESDEQHDALEDATTESHTQCGIHGEKYPDHQPMGFPLDRPIPDERVFLSSDNNAYTIVKVYFKGEH
ncbi:hemocyanin-like [Hyalella azteca]|uniref:Hemocyanin-like n=1 Tax=Hyalella azteca TaxID=294128 RepID=A0A8B7NGU3_HYAAZ|nr:hemocyanin-like [Hyalella azteca]